MIFIYEAKHFIIDSQWNPFVSREEGGHIRVKSKDTTITDRTKLSNIQAVEFMKLSIIAGEALEETMIAQGVDIVKVNYEDAGNWAFKENKAPVLHLHIFGRAKDAKH
jgi:diadenosine tetraphosphate (Ap4A) HIT family hydrolase